MRLGTLVLQNQFIDEFTINPGGNTIADYNIFNNQDDSDSTGWTARVLKFKVHLLQSELSELNDGQDIQGIIESFNDLKKENKPFKFTYNDKIFGTFILMQDISVKINNTGYNDEIILAYIEFSLKEILYTPPELVTATIIEAGISANNELLLGTTFSKNNAVNNIRNAKEKFNAGIQSLSTYQQRASQAIVSAKESLEEMKGYLTQVNNIQNDVAGMYESAVEMQDSLTDFARALASGDITAIGNAYNAFEVSNSLLDKNSVNVNRFSYLRL